MAFSKLKALLRKAATRNFDDLFKALGNICNQFPEAEGWNFFKAAGYASYQSASPKSRLTFWTRKSDQKKF
jgi:hypothetical protein